MSTAPSRGSPAPSVTTGSLVNYEDVSVCLCLMFSMRIYYTSSESCYRETPCELNL